MWILIWDGGREAYYTAEEARFVYFIMRMLGFTVGIEYRRTDVHTLPIW